ncbi:MAG: NADH-quinone oxidoreductase subunit NuoE [Pelagimonas sp.]|jgi:NADH-quinone oxidoreductase subunit E|nr:NADH-quinone oxidoreductase subunit NuoE [Pelagimonas sp.]
MLRRLHNDQPESFAFTEANLAWANEQITKYPAGRQASAVIPLLWRAQEQEGWLSQRAIEAVADMLDMAYIRVFEVASFYFMFQLQPVGSVAHIQICGTTSCMICGAEDLIAVCQEKIATKPHVISDDGKFSWEEVECLGACTNAPMAQIGKDYYEDLTAEKLADLLERLGKGEVPQVGPQNGRFGSEPLGGVTNLKEFVNGAITLNASAQLAHDIGDTVKRIDGTEVPLRAPWGDQSGRRGEGLANAQPPKAPEAPKSAVQQAAAEKAAAENTKETASEPEAPGVKPQTLEAARDGGPDDLKRIKGVGPKLEALLHRLGFFHFDQVAAWTADEVAWVDQNLEGFKGRVSRDEWVKQAKEFAAE